MKNIWWKINAKWVNTFYKSEVNYDEGFYLCPECGEPVYNDDWSEQDFKDFVCPICEFTGGD